jgi:peroxiredoxin
LKVGDGVPDFRLDSQDGKSISSVELRKQGPLVVTFFRGHWWPYCMMELEALQEYLREFKKVGASVVAISPELPSYGRSVRRRAHLEFDLLTDFHLGVAEQFGLVFTLPDYLVEVYETFGTELDKFHGENLFRLPMPARYVIDKQGIIRTADVSADYTVRPEPEATLKALRQLVGLDGGLSKPFPGAENWDGIHGWTLRFGEGG